MYLPTTFAAIFSTWKIWIRETPWTFKWFIWLILLRPFIDNLYFLKEISPLLSPGYWAGLLTPILCINAIITFRKTRSNGLDLYFSLWAVTVAIGALLIFLFDPISLLSVEFLIKLLLPVYLYPMLRRFIRSESDLQMLVYTFLLSFIPVAMILLFELAVNPIRVEESRGMARIQGNFGDVVSYGIYLIFGFASIAYITLQRGVRSFKENIPLVAVLLIALLGLFNIHHVASYAVFALVLGLFLYFFIQERKEIGVIFTVAAFALLIVLGGEIAEERLTPIVAKDMAVYEGEEDSSQLFHGRFGRWQRMWDLFSRESVLSQFMGYPWNFRYSYHYVGMGAHNDFMRMLFLCGYFGLSAYLLFMVNLLIRVWRHQRHIRFLAFSSLAAIVMYSISVTPTFYAPFLYFVLPVFAFLALPVRDGEQMNRAQPEKNGTSRKTEGSPTLQSLTND